MTIEPSHVRFAFGTSVRTWAQDKPPQPIIAKVFRDVGESNDGLTPAVEAVTGALMARMARKAGYSPIDHEAPNGQPIEARGKPAVATARQIAILRFLDEGDGTSETTQLAASENVTCENIYRTCLRLMTRGCLTALSAGRAKAVRWTITDTGRETLDSGILPPLQPITDELP